MYTLQVELFLENECKFRVCDGVMDSRISSGPTPVLNASVKNRQWKRSRCGPCEFTQPVLKISKNLERYVLKEFPFEMECVYLPNSKIELFLN